MAPSRALQLVQWRVIVAQPLIRPQTRGSLGQDGDTALGAAPHRPPSHAAAPDWLVSRPTTLAQATALVDPITALLVSRRSDEARPPPECGAEAEGTLGQGRQREHLDWINPETTQSKDGLADAPDEAACFQHLSGWSPAGGEQPVKKSTDQAGHNEGGDRFQPGVQHPPMLAQ